MLETKRHGIKRLEKNSCKIESKHKNQLSKKYTSANTGQEKAEVREIPEAISAQHPQIPRARSNMFLGQQDWAVVSLSEKVSWCQSWRPREIKTDAQVSLEDHMECSRQRNATLSSMGSLAKFMRTVVWTRSSDSEVAPMCPAASEAGWSPRGQKLLHPEDRLPTHAT